MSEHGVWYKKVRVADDGSLHSLYDPSHVYIVGISTAVQPALPDHQGGWYAYPTVELAVEHNNPDFTAKTAILAVQPHGDCVTYGEKSSFSRLTVVAAIPIASFEPARQAYTAAVEQAWQACEAVAEQAWQAYDATVQQARQARDAAVEQAWQAYNAAVEPAWQAYDAAVEPAGQAYDAAIEQARQVRDAAWLALFQNVEVSK